MHRRSCLRAVGAALPLALAGCSRDGRSDGGDGDDGSSGVVVEGVDTPAADLDDPVTSLTVEYDSRTRFVVEPDEGDRIGASGDTQNLVVQFRVSNDGEAAVEVSPNVFQLADSNEGGGVYDDYDTDDLDQFPDRTLDPGDVANGWLVFEIPAAEARVLLAVSQSQFSDAVAVTFEKADLDVTVDDGESRTTVPNAAPGTVDGPR